MLRYTSVEPPEGFRTCQVDGATLILREGMADALLAAGVHDPESLVRRFPSAHRGRAALARLDLGGVGAIVRCLHRGGLFGKLVRRVSLDRTRALAELVVSARAAARGARVLEVLGAITRPAGLGWTHGLVTREVAGARDLLEVLRTTRGAARRAALRAAGESIARLHAAGVDHVDLNLKNVLLAPDGGALVIDLDRCRLAGEGPASWTVRERNLLRLLRSWHKLASVEPASVERRDPLRLLRAYAGEDRAARERLLAAGRRSTFPCRRLLWRLRPPRVA